MKRRFSPKQYAERLRRQRRRLYLQDGVLSVRFIKFLEPEKPKECRWCGASEANDKGLCIDCFLIWRGQKLPEPKQPQTAEEWAASLDMPSPPWPGGAA